MSDLKKNAFWLYGVVVGLAIKEPLTAVVPHFLPAHNSWLEGLIQTPPGWLVRFEGIRLVIFLLTVIRLYLGAGHFFEKIYGDKCDQAKYPDAQKNYLQDFLVGLIHFVVVFAWALTLPHIETINGRTSPFLFLFLVVLVFDLLWWYLSRGYCTVTLVRRWAVINALVAGIVLLVFYGTTTTLTWSATAGEEAALIVAVPFAIADVMSIVRDQPLFSRFITSLKEE